MKILNLYAGIGGNRKLWGDEHEVTAVEFEPYIAEAYKELYPNDTVIISDAHQYLLDNYEQYDFIWSSPPCPTHSRMNMSFKGDDRKHLLKYPDMKLYQEIIFLQNFFSGKWVVENVISYYDPLIRPSMVLDRHYFWSNFNISYERNIRSYNLAKATKEDISKQHGIILPDSTKDKRKLLRNAVDPKIGLDIINAAQVKQSSLL